MQAAILYVHTGMRHRVRVEKVNCDLIASLVFGRTEKQEEEELTNKSSNATTVLPAELEADTSNPGASTSKQIERVHLAVEGGDPEQQNVRDKQKNGKSPEQSNMSETEANNTANPLELPDSNEMMLEDEEEGMQVTIAEGEREELLGDGGDNEQAQTSDGENLGEEAGKMEEGNTSAASVDTKLPPSTDWCDAGLAALRIRSDAEKAAQTTKRVEGLEEGGEQASQTVAVLSPSTGAINKRLRRPILPPSPPPPTAPTGNSKREESSRESYGYYDSEGDHGGPKDHHAPKPFKQIRSEVRAAKEKAATKKAQQAEEARRAKEKRQAEERRRAAFKPAKKKPSKSKATPPPPEDMEESEWDTPSEADSAISANSMKRKADLEDDGRDSDESDKKRLATERDSSPEDLRSRLQRLKRLESLTVKAPVEPAREKKRPRARSRSNDSGLDGKQTRDRSVRIHTRAPKAKDPRIANKAYGEQLSNIWERTGTVAVAYWEGAKAKLPNWPLNWLIGSLRWDVLLQEELYEGLPQVMKEEPILKRQRIGRSLLIAHLEKVIADRKERYDQLDDFAINPIKELYGEWVVSPADAARISDIITQVKESGRFKTNALTSPDMEKARKIIKGMGAHLAPCINLAAEEAAMRSYHQKTMDHLRRRRKAATKRVEEEARWEYSSPEPPPARSSVKPKAKGRPAAARKSADGAGPDEDYVPNRGAKETKQYSKSYRDSHRGEERERRPDSHRGEERRRRPGSYREEPRGEDYAGRGRGHGRVPDRPRPYANGAFDGQPSLGRGTDFGIRRRGTNDRSGRR